MISLESRLSKIGDFLPTKCLEGIVPTDIPPDGINRRRCIIDEVFNQFFEGGIAHEVENYSDVSAHEAIALATAALHRPLQEVLGHIGVDNKFIPEQIRSPIDQLNAFRSELKEFEENFECVSNVNDTGGFYSVHPEIADLEELLIIFYSSRRFIALYWAEPI